MANIDPVAFGANLRPSTVTLIKKVNELVTAVNEVDPSSIGTLKETVNGLSTNVTTLQSQMVTANSNIAQNTSGVADLNTDMDKVKVTLYTPLTETE